MCGSAQEDGPAPQHLRPGELLEGAPANAGVPPLTKSSAFRQLFDEHIHGDEDVLSFRRSSRFLKAV
jgi:hypothetical protein